MYQAKRENWRTDGNSVDLKCADGTPYVGELTTSMAISYIEIKGKITVTTRHSVYTFEKL